ncbi:hypothetical protein [Deinococcus koreensis]|uniref:Uncharacterized protein n=1 Tax=Deinococcus koreensis TaxID=2054903 RepID=A0A2K3UW11_9DEIO|nr:hypothetical protein [Deinococcus koreensis]PNY80718.1 hypothetical protein CVO96_04465 [Deinococcus koreensis]
MRILSRLLLLVGVIVIIVSAIMLGKDVIDINQLHAVANANRSTNFPSPLNNVLITYGLSLVGAFLLGLGLSLPRGRAPRP